MSSNISIPDIDLSSTPSEPVTNRRFVLERTDVDGNFILRIDNSNLEKFQTCARASQYYSIFAKEKGGSAALLFGGALHKTLERHYLGDSYSDALAAGQSTFLGKTFYPDEFRTPDFLTYVFDLYLTEYHKDSFVPEDVEKAFSLHLFDLEVNSFTSIESGLLLSDGDSSPLYIKTIHVFWSGKIDLKLPNGIADHKTSTQEGPTFFAQFQLSQPIIGYLYAASRIYNQDLTSFMLNAIFLRKPSKTGKGVTFTRYPYAYEKHHFEEWHVDIRHNIQTFVHSLITNVFPKSPVWCVGKFGMCPYHEVCTLSPAQRPYLLNSDMFTDVTWSPLTE